MKTLLKKFLKFKLISSAFLLSLFFIVGGWLWTYFSLRKISQPLILHFSDNLGINQIGSLSDIAVVAVFGIISIVFNCIIAFELEEKDWFLGKLTATAGLFLSILLFIGFAAIISVN